MKKNVEKLNIYRVISLGVLGLLILGLLGAILLASFSREAAAYYEYGNPRVQKTYSDDYSAPVPRPSVYSLNPNPVEQDSGDDTVVVHGSNFVYGAVVRINNSDRTTYYKNGEELSFQLLATDTFRSGDYSVTVMNPGGGLSNSVRFTVVNPALTRRSGGYVPSSSPEVSTYPETRNGEVMGTSYERSSSTSALVSNALYGSGDSGWRPSGLTQWLIFGILVLMVVIVIRKLYFEHKYHATPLKHA